MTDLDRTALQRVVAVINGKGGVLKTTLVSNVAGMLAASGYRVLAVDLDPQGNLAEDFGYDAAEDNDEGQALAQALMFGAAPAIRRDVRPNLDVLVGGPELDTASAGMAAQKKRDPRIALARILAPIADNYDLVLLDCPPGDEMLQTNAIAAARWALVPVKSDKSSRKGLAAVGKRLEAVLDVNPDLDLLGVVLTDVGSTAHAVKREARAQVAELFAVDGVAFADVVFEATVRHSEATAQAARERGKLVFELEQEAKAGPSWWQVRRGDATAGALVPATASSVAGDLHAVAQEIVNRLEADEEAREQSA